MNARLLLATGSFLVLALAGPSNAWHLNPNGAIANAWIQTSGGALVCESEGLSDPLNPQPIAHSGYGGVCYGAPFAAGSKTCLVAQPQAVCTGQSTQPPNAMYGVTGSFSASGQPAAFASMRVCDIQTPASYDGISYSVLWAWFACDGHVEAQPATLSDDNGSSGCGGNLQVVGVPGDSGVLHFVLNGGPSNPVDLSQDQWGNPLGLFYVNGVTQGCLYV